MRTMCSYCKQEFEVSENLFNQSVPCPGCGRHFTVRGVKICAKCGVTNPHNAIICRQCHQDLTTPASFSNTQIAPPRFQPANNDTGSDSSFSDHWGPVLEALGKIFKFLIVLAILGGIAFGGWKGYEYYRKREADKLKKQEEEAIAQARKKAYDDLLALEPEMTNKRLGENLDREVDRVFAKWQKEANNVRAAARNKGIHVIRTSTGGYKWEWNDKRHNEQDVRAMMKRAAYFHSRAYWASDAKRREIQQVRLQNIDYFIQRYNSIMSSVKIAPLPENIQKDLRSLVALSRTDAAAVLKLKHFAEIVGETHDLAEISKLMEQDFSPTEKENLLIVFLSHGKWRKISSNAEEIIKMNDFPQQLLSAEELAEIDRQSAKAFPAGAAANNAAKAAQQEKLKQELMINHLSNKWRYELIDLKTEEYQEALNYYTVIRQRLEVARQEVLTLVIRDHARNFSHYEFKKLERDYNNRADLNPEKKERLEEDYARVMNFARNTERKGTFTYYDERYFEFCNRTSSMLANFGLQPDYPPPNWEKAFPEEKVYLGADNEQSAHHSYRNYDGDDEYATKAKMYEKELSPTELFAEIERVEGIIRRLQVKEKGIPNIPNCELLSGIFLFPEEKRAEVHEESQKRLWEKKKGKNKRRRGSGSKR